ncbi:MAG: hypothetical protein AAF402_10790 [Pseudomonadota bacterium]
MNSKSFTIAFAAASLMVLMQPTYAAKSWGLLNEQEAKFTGTVVDIACELTGNCPANCGEGTRQLGLKTADNGVVLVAKNLTLFTGAADELHGFCGEEIEVDGLYTENQGVKFFQVQRMRPAGGKKWEKSRRFLKAWAARNDSKPRKAKKWYARDARVKAIIERDGRLGLGPEADAEYFK